MANNRKGHRVRIRETPREKATLPKKSANLCWCGQPESKMDIECSRCKRWIHYLCAGLSLPLLVECVHDEPGYYLCRECCALPDQDSVLAATRPDPETSVFLFTDEMYSLMNKSEEELLSLKSYAELSSEISEVKAAQSTMCQALESIAVSLDPPGPAQVVCGQNPRVPLQSSSYASALMRGAGHVISRFDGHPPRPVRGPVPTKVDPPRTVVVGKIQSP